MKFLSICFTSLLLIACSSPVDLGKIESLKVLESSALGSCAQGDEQLGRVKDLLTDKFDSELYLKRVKALNENMVNADSLSISLMNDLNSLRSEIIKQKSSDLDRPNKPCKLEYSKKVKLNTKALPSRKSITRIIKEIEVYRNELCEILVESRKVGLNQEPYEFNTPKLKEFNTDEQKTKSILASLENSRINEEDLNDIISIMECLTKSEDTWEAMLSNKENWVDLSMGILSAQHQILEARRIALRRMWVRIGCCDDFNFSKVSTVVHGATNALPNDTVRFNVYLAAYNEYQDPKVEIVLSGNGRYLGNENGQCLVETVVPVSGKIEVTGKLIRTMKNGVKTYHPWSHTIDVLEKSVENY